MTRKDIIMIQSLDLQLLPGRLATNAVSRKAGRGLIPLKRGKRIVSEIAVDPAPADTVSAADQAELHSGNIHIACAVSQCRHTDSDQFLCGRLGFITRFGNVIAVFGNAVTPDIPLPKRVMNPRRPQRN